jgi:hypothetical protein
MISKADMASPLRWLWKLANFLRMTRALRATVHPEAGNPKFPVKDQRISLIETFAKYSDSLSGAALCLMGTGKISDFACPLLAFAIRSLRFAQRCFALRG